MSLFSASSAPSSSRVARAPDAEPGRHRLAALLARSLLSAPIVLYRRVLSPGLPRRCKYEPTCSLYAVQALREYGILRGLAIAGWRLLRCNPWSHGGYDPVAAQRLFRVDPRRGA